MNLLAIDIGNTNISVGLFIEGQEKSIETLSGNSEHQLSQTIELLWDRIPLAKGSEKREGVICVCSVKPEWTNLIRKICKKKLDEKIYLVGSDVPYPMDLAVDEPGKVGPDRVLSAAAAYAVVEQAVCVADFGTAVTIDMVDERGIFLGGAILPGFELCAKALKGYTAQLPKITVSRPKHPYGKNTEQAINCGLYYSIIGALEEIVRRYAEDSGTWPQTIITGYNAKLLKDDLPFVDSYVPQLVTRGIALAWRKHLENQANPTLGE